MSLPATLTELLREMVAIPSVNPTGTPGTDQVGEQAMGEYVASYLRELGAEVTLDEVEPGRPNVRAVFETESKGAPHLAFAPHLDTVSVAGMTISPFDPVIRDGKLWGRGSSDTKGPMAAALWAVKDWAQGPGRAGSKIRWSFLALMGEEAGNDGAIAMMKRGFSSDLTLVLEPTQLGVVTGHKGVLWLEVSTTGIACHGSTPEKGKSAIYAMRRVLEVVEERLVPRLAQFSHPQLGTTTLNTGTILGGNKINIVPDACRIELDCRFVPGCEAEALRKEVETVIQAEVPEARVQIQRVSLPLDTNANLPWVKTLEEESRGLTTAPWFSDASVFSQSGCPAVCVGPGSIAQAHTKDEFILLSDLEEGAEFFKRWMCSAETAEGRRW